MTRIGRRVQEAKKIAAKLVKTEIVVGLRTFKADFYFDKSDYPKTAKVVLSATSAGVGFTQRFEFGTIKNVAPEKELRLDDKLSIEHIRFTLKIIDTSQEFGRILGVAENIIPINIAEKNLGGKDGILPIESSDLGELLWRLEFGEHEVVLLVNKTIPGFRECFGTGGNIDSLVLPAICREVLWRIWNDDKFDLEDEQEEGWKAKWIRFAKTFDSNIPNDSTDENEIADWIDGVVQKFCEIHRFKQRYTKHFEEED